MLYSKFVEHVLFRLGDLAIGTDFVATLQNCRDFEKLSISDTLKIRVKCLNNLLDFAEENCSHYKINESRVGNNTDVYTRLRSYPIMDKEAIRLHSDGLLTMPRPKLVVERCSGSSGIQGEMWTTRREQLRAYARQVYIFFIVLQDTLTTSSGKPQILISQLSIV